MKKFEETIWPTKDRTKNYILQLIDEKDRTIKNLINEGLGTEFIARVSEVTPEYVENIRQNTKNS